MISAFKKTLISQLPNNAKQDMKNQKILIIGAQGQLGSEFHKHLADQTCTCLAPQEKDCSITDPTQLKEVLDNFKPDIVINCAAFNAVDEAENNPDLAYQINGDAVKQLAELTDRYHGKLVHYSSDYVFDGAKQDLYVEEDPTHPLNVYGKSKLAGETAALDCNPDNLVFRLSWVIGRGKQNFLHKLSGWAQNQKVLKISADEASVPTFTDDVVHLTLKSIENGLSGLYHLTNSGYASRYELARFYASQVNLQNTIIPVSMSSFKTSAKRPLFSAMSNATLSNRLNIDIPSWQEGLIRFISTG